MDERKLNAECRAYVNENGFTLRPYNDIYKEITRLAKQETILLDPMINLTCLFGRLAKEHRAGHIRAIAILYAADIEHDGITALSKRHLVGGMPRVKSR